VDEVIRFIGSIEWDREGIDIHHGEIDPSHPFSPVFDAIAYIKGELDDHFQERMKAEERFKILFEEAPDAYFLIDIKGTIIDGNKEMENLIGYQKEELIGKNILAIDLIPEGKKAKAAVVLGRNVQGLPTGPDEFPLKRSDDFQVTVDIRMHPVEINGKKLILGLARDITARKEVEDALKESEEKYRTIIQSIQDGYYELDLRGNFTFVNESMARVLGYSREELIGMNYREYMDEETAQNVYRIFNRVYRSGKPDEGSGWEFTSKGGSKKYVEASVSLVRDPDDQPVGFRGILRDITPRKRDEIAIRKAHDDLEKKVYERTRELAESNERLRKEILEREDAQGETLHAKETAEKANQAKSEFLANMSHELRTPLNHIIGFTELIVDKKFGELSEMQEEYLNDVLHSSRHLLSLINDILDLSKVEAGRLDFQPAEVEINLLLENSLTLIKEKAMKHGIRLSVDTNGVPDRIRADERKLKQIMYNLISNAVKFTPNGGEVCIRAGLIRGLDSGIPMFQEHSNKEFIEISVIDSGIGIHPDHLKRIFKPFEQADNSASRKYQGTGLGLSLTKTLVELHDGKIWAQSEGEGKGSTFRFVIPI